MESKTVVKALLSSNRMVGLVDEFVTNFNDF